MTGTRPAARPAAREAARRPTSRLPTAGAAARLATAGPAAQPGAAGAAARPAARLSTARPAARPGAAGPTGRRPAGLALLAAVLMLTTACSAPANVTESAGVPSSGALTTQSPVAVGEVPAELAAALPACTTTGRQSPVPGGLPDLSLACLGPDGPVELTGLRGPLIINVWASWCAPCRNELPALASFAEDKVDVVSVLGLNVSDSPAAAAALWGQLLMPFASLTDPQGATRADLGWIGLPVTYFVDAEGEIVARHDGAITDSSEWEAVTQRNLGVP